MTLKRMMGSVALGVLLVVATTYAHSAEISEKAALQAAMQQHIDRSLVGGVYLHLDMDSGEVHSLYPLRAHPEILRMGNYFVLCADFKNIDSKSVNVDFYVARDNGSLVVFHSAVDDRTKLEQWMSEGKVERFN